MRCSLVPHFFLVLFFCVLTVAKGEDFPPEPREPIVQSNIITEQSLCGPISLSLGAKKLGIDVEVSKLSQMVKLDPSGTSMSELAKAATQIGIEAVPYRLRSTNLLLKLAENNPAIVLIRGNHFVLVWGGDEGKLWIAEYPLELRQIAPEELAKEWDPRVLVLSKMGSRDPFAQVSSQALTLTVVLSLTLLAALSTLYSSHRKRRVLREAAAGMHGNPESNDPSPAP